MFEAWGRFIFRHRRLVLAVSAVLLAGSIVGVLNGGALSTGNSFGADLEAGRASRLVSTELRPAQSTSGSNFDLVFSSAALTVDDPAYRSDLEAAIARLRADPKVLSVLTPYDSAAGPSFRSKDGHSALVTVSLHEKLTPAKKDYPALRAEVNPSVLTVLGTGQVPIDRAFDTTLEGDLQRAELVSLPVSLILLLLVFGAVIAGLLPIAVGVLAVVGGLSGTLLLARFTDVSQYALNIVTLIGLGVAIDYSLFVVNRFREELAYGHTREDALALTVGTAGRAITFSGLTVAIGLAGMLFYRGTFLASMGAAGAISVFIAVFYGLTFLPALLAVMGPKVDALRIPLVGVGRAGPGGFWHAAAGRVMQRPWLVLVPMLALLIAAGVPFLHIRLANGDVDMLPPRLEARQGYDQLIQRFPGFDQTTFTVVLNYPDGNPLTSARVGDLFDLNQKIAAIGGVNGVTSPLSIAPGLSRAASQAMLSGSPSALPQAARDALAQSVGKHIVVLQATSGVAPEGDPARAILKSLRALGTPGGQVLVTGQTAFDVDIIGFILQQTPAAFLAVVIATYVLLFFLTGSVVLPLKALVMNLLSLGASFGALVWIFQDGHLSSQLGFTPQSIDPTIPVLLFCIVFGLSMDYEVLLVSRIHEEYLRLGDNRAAVAEGLARSGRLITGAAGVMVAVFIAFGLAEVVLIKAIGIGLAVAVAIDATVVRILVVPAVMRLLGDFNWWAPPALSRLYDRLRIGDLPAEPPLPEPVPQPG